MRVPRVHTPPVRPAGRSDGYRLVREVRLLAERVASGALRDRYDIPWLRLGQTSDRAVGEFRQRLRERAIRALGGAGYSEEEIDVFIADALRIARDNSAYIKTPFMREYAEVSVIAALIDAVDKVCGRRGRGF